RAFPCSPTTTRTSPRWAKPSAGPAWGSTRFFTRPSAAEWGEGWRLTAGFITVPRQVSQSWGTCGWIAPGQFWKIAAPAGRWMRRYVARWKRVKKACCGSGVAAHPGGEAKFLSKALQKEDALAQRIVRETAGDLGFGLSHVVHLFHPQLIVLG